jgi:hypothetical protein
MNKLVYHEIIEHVLEYWTPNEWGKYLYVLVYDSEIYGAREFAIIFDLDYNILYHGWDASEAYFSSQRAPVNPNLLNIYYIRNMSDFYIFFDEKGKKLNQGLKFIKIDNMDGEIIAKTLDNKWYIITKTGPIPEQEAQSES